ncbi:hypothetical protein RJ55_06264 [Drechmeria coniospora]|nr:hypothetical protein RJ55_06264 [Drechmeria coniospora]
MWAQALPTVVCAHRSCSLVALPWRASPRQASERRIRARGRRRSTEPATNRRRSLRPGGMGTLAAATAACRLVSDVAASNFLALLAGPMMELPGGLRRGREGTSKERDLRCLGDAPTASRPNAA